MKDNLNSGQQALNIDELDKVTGGTESASAENERTVSGLKSGYLAMRTIPAYGSANEMLGHELHNGDNVVITGETVIGTDGKTYVRVISCKDGASGYVDAAFLNVN